MQAYFKAQLDQYLDWLDRRGLSQNALADAREEVLDHENFMDIDCAHPIWLPFARIKTKMEVSDADWDASMPRIATELRKGRRDMLRRVLEVAKGLEHYAYDDTTGLRPCPSCGPSSRLAGVIVAGHGSG
ncbi:hypothetical protein GCM10008024_40650 [Allgaiera indica]|uniref:Uncharacterized protein n=1 Tax=Allgaiera indica TaxID=765699 RepID=A0AAN5A326_9RHOB|nr:hypothetical protein GCM10008024_40650 [Allgaiera indica]